MIKKKQRIHPQIILDWFNITYRSFFLGILAVLLLIGAALFVGYYLREGSPKAEAREEISRARSLYDQADDYEWDEKLAVLGKNAGNSLDQARAEFDRKNYTDSKIAAIRSQNYSQKIIDIARGEQTTSTEVRFYKIEGDVKVKRIGTFNWESASPKTLLRFGDQVKTSSTSSAQVIYFDGTITTISPGSLLEIKEIYEDPKTRVQKVHERLSFGTLQASTQKRRTEGSSHEVSTETASAKSTHEADFKVSYDKDSQESSFDLYQGSLELLSPGEKALLEKPGRVKVAREGKIGAREEILPAPKLISPADQKIFLYANPDSASTTLVWGGIPGGAAYHLMISSRPLFTNAVVDKKDVKETFVEVASLAAGSYYWKVATISGTGVEGNFSEPRKFKITSSQLRDKSDTIPPRMEITEFLMTGPLVIINGKTEPGATLWVDAERVDVYDNGVFYAVVKLRKEGWNDITIVAQDSSGNEIKIKKRAYLEGFY